MSRAAETCLLACAGFLMPVIDSGLRAQTLPPSTSLRGSLVMPGDLQLEVYMDNVSTKLLATFHQDTLGHLSMDPADLADIGLVASRQARLPDGNLDISKLPGVQYRYDEATQAIYFTAENSAKATRIVNAGAPPEDRPKAVSSVGALVNYTLYTSTGGNGWGDIDKFQGISGSFEGRMFSPWGVVSSSQIVSFSPGDSSYATRRLDTAWSYQDEQHLLSYRAGDIITGGLNWTRPTRLGGIQIQRSFDLRPDLVTMPLPQLSGSAAVPSTVDVYIDNTRRLSSDLPAGPFSITNLPVVTGDGTARLVVRDALGRETVSESPFYASANLLAPGLLDFSAETGFARRFYGLESFDYEDEIVGSALLRYGLTSAMTLEAHAEGGASLLNGGLGGVFDLDNYGVGSVAGAASLHDGATGYQVAASIETEIWGARIFARTQRTFGDYDDIASITDAKNATIFSSRAPKTLNQISLSVPLKFDPTTLSLSYTELQTASGNTSRIVGWTANRAVGQRGNIFVTAYKDFARSDTFGLFAGLSWSFSDGLTGSSGASSDGTGSSITTDLVKSENQAVGSYGWRIHDAEGSNTMRSASASYHASFARVEGDVTQYRNSSQVSAQMDGAAILAGGDLFFGNRVDDAFAVVDAGSPGVDVKVDNRPAGRTNNSGRLLVAGLRSYDSNRISIDPGNLPLDATINSTNEVVVPRGQSGTVVNFGVKADSKAILLTLRGEDGAPLEAGSVGRIDGKADSFIVGYDGQAYVAGLTGKPSRLVIDRPDGTRCQTQAAAAGDVICHAAP